MIFYFLGFDYIGYIVGLFSFLIELKLFEMDNIMECFYKVMFSWD